MHHQYWKANNILFSKFETCHCSSKDKEESFEKSAWSFFKLINLLSSWFWSSLETLSCLLCRALSSWYKYYLALFAFPLCMTLLSPTGWMWKERIAENVRFGIGDGNLPLYCCLKTQGLSRCYMSIQLFMNISIIP